jgi:excinuclease UvrABC ATPase subunit
MHTRCPTPSGRAAAHRQGDRGGPKPIGRTPRSNPATYTGLFDHIRELYANLPSAKIRGYKAGRFSFNTAGGRCETCKGAGVRVIEMNFLPDVSVPCETCRGKRYDRETLEVRFKGKSIADVLAMPVEEAMQHFSETPIHRHEAEDPARRGPGLCDLRPEQHHP